MQIATRFLRLTKPAALAKPLERVLSLGEDPGRAPQLARPARVSKVAEAPIPSVDSRRANGT